MTMDFASVICTIYMFTCCSTCLIACAFLAMAIINRHRCFIFTTLLTCNTALATLLFSATNLAATTYMLLWDKQAVPAVDSLCPIRAYFHHSTIACIHHSFVLQAIEKYCKIKGITFLHSRRRKICFVLAQWILDFTFGLPVLLTGNMTKVISDNLCLVSFFRLDLIFYLAGVTFLLSDITISVIYHSLVRHVYQASSKVHATHQTQMRRQLTIVRRIVFLNFQLALVGIPVLIFIILNTINLNLLPYKGMRVVLMIMNLPLSPMLVILFWFTPELRQSLIKHRNQVQPFYSTRIRRVQPQSNTHRF